MTRYKTAEQIYRQLNGVFCAIKSPGKNMGDLIGGMRANLLRRLNQLPQRPIKKRIIYHEENWGTDKPLASLVDDLSDHILVAGPRYRDRDIQFYWADKPDDWMSGLMVFGINECPNLWKLQEACHMRVYHVKGQFGRATDDFTVNGRTLEKSTYRHIRRYQLEKLLSAIQAGQQKYMYQLAGVELQSQEAYDLATSGLLRARVREEAAQLLYGIKCIDFEPPFFTVEIHCVNETVRDIGRLIHNIGTGLRSNACVTQCRRIRWGKLTLDHALNNVNKTKPEVIAQCIKICERVLRDGPLEDGGNIMPAQQPSLLSGVQDVQAMLRSGRVGYKQSSQELIESAMRNQRETSKQISQGLKHSKNKKPSVVQIDQPKLVEQEPEIDLTKIAWLDGSDVKSYDQIKHMLGDEQSNERFYDDLDDDSSLSDYVTKCELP